MADLSLRQPVANTAPREGYARIDAATGRPTSEGAP